MQPTTNSLISATRKTAKLLQRDFFELEMLQHSNRGTFEFCNRSYLRTKDFLREELQKISKFSFFADESPQLPNNLDIAIFVNPIDGIENLGKGLPFFGVSVTFLKRINELLTPIYTVINFPALGEIFYAEKGRGAWIEKSMSDSFDKAIRLRVSGCNNIENAIIATNDITKLLKFSKNSRYFGSFYYELALFAAGKIDIISFTATNYTFSPIFDLVVQESGGLIIDQYIATNSNLAEKLKQLIIKNLG